MRVLQNNEIAAVSGGLNDFQEGGIAIIGLALITPVTAPLALIGLACLYVGSQ